MKEDHEGMQIKNDTDKARWEEDNEVQEAEKQEAEMIQGGCTAKYKHTYTLAQY